MAIAFNRAPYVVTTTPINLAVDIPTNIPEIVIEFSTDLDINHVYGNFRMQHVDSGNFLQITIEYAERYVTLKPVYPLYPNTSYQITVQGDVNAGDGSVTGVRNVFGTPLAGTFSFQFQTASVGTLPPPQVVRPLTRVQVSSTPTFTWAQVETATYYEIQVSRSPDFVPVLWPLGGTRYECDVTEVTPMMEWGDGNYYWRIRTYNPEEQPGEWSESYVFHINQVIEGKVVDEDTLPPEEMISYEHKPYLDELDIVEMFPKTDATNMSQKVKTIYIRVLGTVTKDDISELTIEGYHVSGEELQTYADLSGISVDERPTDYSHGVVTGTYDVFPQNDGTTIIAFTPDILTNLK